MSYLKKEYRNLIDKSNKELKFPTGWYYFVKKEQAKQNFIIKSNNVCFCNNCKFQFKSAKKINEQEKCPNCHQTYKIKQKNYTWHIFTNVLILVDELDDKWVIRLFEIFSRFTLNNVYHSKPAEYGRVFIDKKSSKTIELVNDRFMRLQWGTEYVNHTRKGDKWRIGLSTYYNSVDCYGKVYDKNLQELFANSKLKYSQIWTLAKKCNNLDIKYQIIHNYPSTEFLVKLQLYNLAKSAGEFNNGKNFQERFGIDKSYYEFMKENNINKYELEILKLYRKTDINEIRFLTQFQKYYLNKVMEYTNLEKFVKYAQKKKRFDIKIYLDYLDFATKLKIDLKNKKYLFPINLREKHDEYSRQLVIKKNQKVNREIKKRYKLLQKNIYSNKTYIIKPADSYISLEDESTQQNHCVRNYAERYAQGECDIYFMRVQKTPNKSLVTIEVRKGEIIQSRIKDNYLPNKSQKSFIKKWEANVLKAA